MENEEFNQDDLLLEFGTPNYDNERTQREYVTERRLQLPKAGEMYTVYVARIIPPVKSQKKNGKYISYGAKHFGTFRKSAKSGKLYPAPYLCLFKGFGKGSTMTITRPCPKCEDIATKKADLVRSIEEWKRNGKTEDEIKELSKPLNDWLKKHNRDVKYYLNVMTPDGKFELLALTKGAKEALEVEINKLRSDGYDPLSLTSGVWFNFTRAGSGNKPVDSVSVVREAQVLPNGKRAEVIKEAPMTQAQMKKALEICPDLDSELGEMIRKLSTEQIRSLVNGSEDPDFVEAVFKAGTKIDPAPTLDVYTSNQNVNTSTVIDTNAVTSSKAVLNEDFWDRVTGK